MMSLEDRPSWARACRASRANGHCLLGREQAEGARGEGGEEEETKGNDPGGVHMWDYNARDRSQGMPHDVAHATSDLITEAKSNAGFSNCQEDPSSAH